MLCVENAHVALKTEEKKRISRKCIFLCKNHKQKEKRARKRIEFISRESGMQIDMRFLSGTCEEEGKLKTNKEYFTFIV